MSNVECTFYCQDSDENQKNLFTQALLSAKNGKVLYILQEELNELPKLSQDLVSVNRHYMKMISFLYVHNLKDLIESVCTLPEWQNVPCAIILEDLCKFCENNLQNACALVALLADATYSCAKSLNITGKLFISMNKEIVGKAFCDTLIELYSR